VGDPGEEKSDKKHRVTFTNKEEILSLPVEERTLY